MVKSRKICRIQIRKRNREKEWGIAPEQEGVSSMFFQQAHLSKEVGRTKSCARYNVTQSYDYTTILKI